MIIEKKAWPVEFQAIVDGRKNYELRLADWSCGEGDTLLLKEWDPITRKYTGRELKKNIKYVAHFKLDDTFWPKEDIEKYGLQIISLE